MAFLYVLSTTAGRILSAKIVSNPNTKPTNIQNRFPCPPQTIKS